MGGKNLRWVELKKRVEVFKESVGRAIESLGVGWDTKVVSIQEGGVKVTEAEIVISGQ